MQHVKMDTYMLYLIIIQYPEGAWKITVIWSKITLSLTPKYPDHADLQMIFVHHTFDKREHRWISYLRWHPLVLTMRADSFSCRVPPLYHCNLQRYLNREDESKRIKWVVSCRCLATHPKRKKKKHPNRNALTYIDFI